MAKKFISPAEARLFDWALLALIVAFGGSSFVMIRSAVETIPAMAVAPIRLWIGAVLLYALMRQAGRRLPPLIARGNGQWRIRRSWVWMIGVGAVGNVLPFFIFPWAQQFVDSGLAGIYMAFMPIWTIALAFFFAGESVDRRKMTGFALGFLGVVVLMGPDVLKGALSSDMGAQAALLLATFLYAAAAVLARRAPPIRPRVFAAGMMLVAAVMATPALFFINLETDQWSAWSMASLIGLGVFPTGVNGVLIIMLIRRAGAGFMSLTNYITPLWAVAMGAAIYGEHLEPAALVALAIILAGVAVSQRARFAGRATGSAEAGDGLAGELGPIVEKAGAGDQTKS